MAYDYKFLAPEQRRAIAVQQATQFEAEIFGHELNLARLRAGAADDPEVQAAISASQEAIETITEAIEATAAIAIALPVDEAEAGAGVKPR